MNLLDFAQETLKPTSDQIKALMALDYFLQSDEKCFLLKGYAGTGKTTITKALADYLIKQKIQPVLMAPTGRAAIILAEKTNKNATTIHKGIYNLDELDEINIGKEEKKQFKFRYKLKTVNDNIKKVYFIDEASMISDKNAESDFFVFGSGKLLQDIITFISPQNTARKDKIIFIGDPAQLPPVADSNSGALDENYLMKTYNLPVSQYELTKVVRQAQDSGILRNADLIRDSLFQEVNKTFQFEFNSKDVFEIKSEWTAKKYQELNPELKFNKTVVLNFSNSSALENNLSIRSQFFEDRNKLEVGDLLMIQQNNYNYEVELFNGTQVKVLTVSQLPETKSNIKSYDATGNVCMVSLTFREVTIQLPEEFGANIINCFILDDFLYSKEPTLNYAQNIALYIDFKIRHAHLNPKTKEFKDALRKDRYFNVLKVKYGYAITCHKAQGGEWNNVLLNMDIGLGKSSKNFKRWCYTAITRATDSAFIFNYLKENPFNKINFNPNYLPDNTANTINTVSNITCSLPENYYDILQIHLLIDEPTHFQNKFKEIYAIASFQDIEILKRTKASFQEKYVFSKEGKTAELSFWYNGKYSFTKITATNSTSFNSVFSAELLQLFNKTYNIQFIERQKDSIINTDTIIEELKTSMEHFFPEPYQSLSILFHTLNPLLNDENISIISVIHNQFQEVYKFVRNDEFSTLHFYYDNKNNFTSVTNNAKNCNSNKLLVDLDRIIKLIQQQK